MRISHLCNSKIYVARLANLTGNKMAFATVTAEMGHIQPMSNFSNQVSDGVFSKTFRVYFDGEADIKEGDRLRDENDNYYTVKSDGVSRRTFGSFDFLIVIMEKNK